MRDCEDKAAIRKVMRGLRKALTQDERAHAAKVVCAKIIAGELPMEKVDPYDGWGALAVYLASPDEIDLSEAIAEMLARGVTVVAPRWNGETYELAKLKSLREEDLRKGPMGILEPKDAEIVAPKNVGVWLIPGLAFTRDGKRLGYGGGWYDRLLAEADSHASKYGIAHSFQIVDDLPSEQHDILIDKIIDASLDHPQIEFRELPDGCWARESIAHRRRWRMPLIGGLLSAVIFMMVTKCLENGYSGVVLEVLMLACVIAIGVAVIGTLYTLGGPYEAELELKGEKGYCCRRWLGFGRWSLCSFEWKPWTKFAGGGYAFYNAPGLSELMVVNGAEEIGPTMPAIRTQRAGDRRGTRRGKF